MKALIFNYIKNTNLFFQLFYLKMRTNDTDWKQTEGKALMANGAGGKSCVTI